MIYHIPLVVSFLSVFSMPVMAEEKVNDGWWALYLDNLNNHYKKTGENFDAEGNPYPCAINGVETILEACSYSQAELLLRAGQKYSHAELDEKCDKYLDSLKEYAQRHNCPKDYVDFITMRRNLWLEMLYPGQKAE